MAVRSVGNGDQVCVIARVLELIAQAGTGDLLNTAVAQGEVAGALVGVFGVTRSGGSRGCLVGAQICHHAVIR